MTSHFKHICKPRNTTAGYSESPAHLINSVCRYAGDQVMIDKTSSNAGQQLAGWPVQRQQLPGHKAHRPGSGGQSCNTFSTIDMTITTDEQTDIAMIYTHYANTSQFSRQGGEGSSKDTIL